MMILIKGAGDIATGIALRLYRASFQVIMTEIPQPTVIRRTISFAQAVYDGTTMVENIKGVLVHNVDEALTQICAGNIPVIVDENAAIKDQIEAEVVVDAILAKKNIGTQITDAEIVIGVGPGFEVGKDVHAVVETMRGHDLGRVLYHGTACPNTGIPGNIGGEDIKRIVKAPSGGIFTAQAQIGDLVAKDDILGFVEQVPVVALIGGCLRGMLSSGLTVYPGMKIGDIDPRNCQSNCYTASDKANAMGGAVLEAVMHFAFLQGKRLVKM